MTTTTCSLASKDGATRISLASDTVHGQTEICKATENSLDTAPEQKPCCPNMLALAPIYVTNMPVGLRAYNGQYNPLFSCTGQFSGMWRCERKTYWGVTIRPILIRYDAHTNRWIFDRYLEPNQWQLLYESAKCDPDHNHPVFVRWPGDICVSHHKPWFWQVL